MRIYMVFFVLAIAPIVAADTYRWVDDKGALHYTDNPSSIPEKYLPTAEKLEAGDLPGVTTIAPEGGEARPVLPQEGEGYWRSAFQRLKAQTEFLRGGLAGKKERLEELRRKRLLFHRTADRVALKELEEEIAKDEEQIVELEKQLEELDRKASRAGVPLEWRR